MIKLRLFDTPSAASDAQAKSSVVAQILELPGKGFCLKKPGLPNIEPKFLCEDGRWRCYDLIPDLPHSTASL